MPAFDSLPAPASAGEITISTDKSLIDVALVHGWLQRTHWAEGIPLETVRRSIGSSLCFGAYEGGRQVGFARVITDYATFAYLADVVVDEAARGRGIGQRMMKTILAHPDLQGLRRWLLVTRDARSLYERFGFTDPSGSPVLEKLDRDLYKR